MGIYEELKQEIREVVKPNNLQEINGANMQATLLSIVDVLGTSINESRYLYGYKTTAQGDYVEDENFKLSPLLSVSVGNSIEGAYRANLYDLKGVFVGQLQPPFTILQDGYMVADARVADKILLNNVEVTSVTTISDINTVVSLAKMAEGFGELEERLNLIDEEGASIFSANKQGALLSNSMAYNFLPEFISLIDFSKVEDFENYARSQDSILVDRSTVITIPIQVEESGSYTLYCSSANLGRLSDIVYSNLRVYNNDQLILELKDSSRYTKEIFTFEKGDSLEVRIYNPLDLISDIRGFGIVANKEVSDTTVFILKSRCVDGKLSGTGQIVQGLPNFKVSTDGVPIFSKATYRILNSNGVSYGKIYDDMPIVGVTVPTGSIDNYPEVFSFDDAEVGKYFAYYAAIYVENGYSELEVTLRTSDFNNYIIDKIFHGIGDTTHVVERIYVREVEVIKSVEKQVISTEIEVVSSARNAANYGVLPSNSGAENYANLQSMLNLQGDIIIDMPGVYEIDGQLEIGSDTSMLFGKATIMKMMNSDGGFLINKGALTREYDRNITIRGLNLDTNGKTGSTLSSVNGLRGYLGFFYVEDLILSDIYSYDYSIAVYFIHLAKFRRVIAEKCNLQGLKDGFHISGGDGLIIRDCYLSTEDDPIALNAHDYTNGCPNLNWIKNVVIENCTYDAFNGSTKIARAIHALAGAWLDWKSGNSYQHSDTVVGSNGYVYRLIMPVDGREYTSTVEPTSTNVGVTGAELADGLKWLCLQADTVYNVGIENIVIRNYRIKRKSHTGFAFRYDMDMFSRGLYPGAVAVPSRNLQINCITTDAEVDTGNLVSLDPPIEEVIIENCNADINGVLVSGKIYDTVLGNNETSVTICKNKFRAREGNQSYYICNTALGKKTYLNAVGNLASEVTPSVEIGAGEIVVINNDLKKY